MTNGTHTTSYAYNRDGIRIKKTVDGVVTDYFLRGTQIIHLTSSNGTDLQFHYDACDACGKPTLVTHNGADYWYLYNLQGDVVGLANASKQLVVEYTYDPWGKPLYCTGTMAGTLGVANPFRYRGCSVRWDVG
jgi:YD repeat-containing protein